MAEKKAKKAATKKTASTATFNGQTYTILESTPDRVKLTDGLIHFWVKAKDVTAS